MAFHESRSRTRRGIWAQAAATETVRGVYLQAAIQQWSEAQFFQKLAKKESFRNVPPNCMFGSVLLPRDSLRESRAQISPHQPGLDEECFPADYAAIRRYSAFSSP